MEAYQNAKNVGEAFLQSYFSSNDPNNLINFYGSDSLLSFESEVLLGAQDIVSKISSLPIKQHEAKNWDIQPSGNGILIYLSGLLLIEGENNPVNFVRVFFLANMNNSYYVKNDIYKITFG